MCKGTGLAPRWRGGGGGVPAWGPPSHDARPPSLQPKTLFYFNNKRRSVGLFFGGIVTNNLRRCEAGRKEKKAPTRKKRAAGSPSYRGEKITNIKK